MYIGEIVHKGRYYPGQHPPILTSAQWQAAHDVLAQTAEERRAAVATDGRGLPLPLGWIEQRRVVERFDAQRRIT